MPLISMRSPLTRKLRLVSLPFCDIGGCLGDDSTIESELSDAALDLATRLGAAAIEIRGRSLDTVGENPDAAGQAGKKYSMLMPLPETPDELWDGFKSKLRSQIRKAEKNGLTHSIGNSPEYIESFYRVFTINMHNLGSPVHSRNLFESVARNYSEKAVISLVKMGNNVVAAGFLLLLDQIATLPWASTIPRYNRYAPNMLLYWSLLEHATKHGCRRFDFGRSTFGEGTYRFKQQWGAQPADLKWRVMDGSGNEFRHQGGASRLRPIVEKTWRTLPLSTANKIGPLIRKHIDL
jgi:FemAB-related protein (PEP-CTERM system-associated)